MSPRFLASVTAMAALVASTALVPAPALSQAKPAAATAKPQTKWTAPRTPWGDPDLQGSFSNLSENGTPLERPDQYAGRKLEDIKGEELAKIRQGMQDRTVQNFAGPLHAPDGWWQHDLNMAKGGQAWLVVDPPDGRIPPLTSQALDRAGLRAEARRTSGRGPSDSWEDRSYYDRCITRGLPGSMMPAIYGNSYEIVQTPGYVAIVYEMIHEARIIPLDGKPHVGKSILSYMGDARGYWEGDTLVVETRNFKDETAYRQANGPTMRLVERFTRVGPDTVRWSVTVDDPETWTKPWTFSMPLTRDATQPPLEYSCHEGNLGLANILSVARAEERQAAEAAGRR